MPPQEAEIDSAHPGPGEDPAESPLSKFARWFREAQSQVEMPEAMTLATSSAEGVPSARMVLLRGFDERGFVFFTNYGSPKSRDLHENPLAALVLYWQPLGRQVRINGPVERVAAEESDAYWLTRPPGSRRAAIASRQSEVLPDRRELEEHYARLAELHAESPPPRPEDWGGFRVAPRSIEFWTNGEFRLHHRLRYRIDGDRWESEELYP